MHVSPLQWRYTIIEVPDHFQVQNVMISGKGFYVLNPQGTVVIVGKHCQLEEGKTLSKILLGRVPQRLEKWENENGHEKVIEYEKLAKSHGIL